MLTVVTPQPISISKASIIWEEVKQTSQDPANSAESWKAIFIRVGTSISAQYKTNRKVV